MNHASISLAEQPHGYQNRSFDGPWRIIVKRPGQCLSLLARALAFASSVAGRAVWLALATMLSASAASAAGPILGGGLPAPYQQYGAAPICSTGSCGITFPTVTAETLISQVTCYFYLTNTDGAYDAYLWNGVNGAGAAYNHLPPIETGTYNGDSTYAINAQTQMFLRSGQQPSVTVLNFVGTIPQFDCSVSGHTGSQPAPYQQYVSTNSCKATFCGIAFPPVTAETLISHVTCYLYLNNTDPIFFAELSSGSGATFVSNFFLPVETGMGNGGTTYYVINAQTQMFLSSGQTPTVQVANFNGTISQLDCSVSGYTGSQLAARPATAPPAALSAAGPIPSGPTSPSPYQQYLENGECSAGSCAIAFPTVTAETLISQVTCYLYLNNTEPVDAANLSNGAVGAGQVVNWLPVTTSGTVNDYTAYVINAQTQMLLSSGQTPSVSVFNSVGSIEELECSLSGYTGSKLAARAGPTPPSPGSVPPFFPRAIGQ
jgi:hypothetical protein